MFLVRVFIVTNQRLRVQVQFVELAFQRKVEVKLTSVHLNDLEENSVEELKHSLFAVSKFGDFVPLSLDVCLLGLELSFLRLDRRVSPFEPTTFHLLQVLRRGDKLLEFVFV